MVSHNYRTGPPSAKWQNFATSGPMFHNFYCSIRKGSAEEGGIKNTTSPQIYCRITLWKASGQLYSFTAQLIQFKVMKNV